MKKNNNKGFTLAELLIVVAIIAVLVAIAIPVFTSQLEKSKEATDISNIRSYYAEITTNLLTGDLKEKNNSVKVGNDLTATLNDNLPSSTSGTFSVTVSGTNMKFKQSVEDWQTAEFDIAGVKGGKSVTDGVGQWKKTSNSIKYTFSLDAEGDYYLTGVELPGPSGGSGGTTNP